MPAKKADSVRVIVFALAANLGIALAKSAGALVSGSASLLAEAIHSFVDCSNQVLLLVGHHQSGRKPTARHPLGFGREAFFWSFVVAILLFSLGGLFAIYEGVHKLENHEAPDHPMLGLGIIVVSLFLEAGSFVTCLKQVRRENTFGSLWAWLRGTTSSDLLVVFLEDTAALLGLTIAGIFLSVSWYTGNPWWDAAGSIAIGSILVLVAVILAVETKSLLIGEAPAVDYEKDMGQIMAAHVPGAELLHLIAIQAGPSSVTVSMKVTPGTVTEVKTLIDGINAAEREIKARFPEVRWLFVEPDYED